ncbi:hypothetical protein HDU96_002450 [Phlyctochytrium bullatum]|nr:hypothetical protein HDU96_002450 [Phlyctochytrium bullatum]
MDNERARRAPSPSKTLNIDCLAPEIAQMILLCVNPRYVPELICDDVGVARKHLLRFYSEELLPRPREDDEDEDDDEEDEDEAIADELHDRN